MGAKVFLTLGLSFGGMAYLLVSGYVERVRASAPQVGEPVGVVVATTTTLRGSPLRATAVEVIQIPSAYVPPGAIDDVEDAVGRILLADIGPGEIVTGTRLAQRGLGPVASLVPQGFRAFPVTPSLPVGSVRAGDRVDVLGTFAGGRPHTETVASDVEVLLVTGTSPEDSAGQGLLDAGISPGTNGQTLMLLVLPYQAEDLAFARAFADLTVSISGAEEEPEA